MLPLQIGVNGRIVYDPRFYPAEDGKDAMWSAKIEFDAPPTTSRNGQMYSPKRQVEVVTYGLAAVRAAESCFKPGDVIIALGWDLQVRCWEQKPRGDNPNKRVEKDIRAIAKIIVSSVAKDTRYEAIAPAESSWPPVASTTARLVQGAATRTREEPPVPAVA